MKNIKEEKTIIRKEMLSQRNALSFREVEYKNKQIQKFFCSLSLLKNNQSFMSYVNIGKEVKTLKIIKELIKKDKIVTVPLCIPKTTELLASQIFDLDELGLSPLRLLEPKINLVRPTEPKDLEVILVPGLAFDRKGNRLGYGKGYYDRFFSKLSSNALKIGLAYSFQILEKVPIDHYDVPLDIIINEEEIIDLREIRR